MGRILDLCKKSANHSCAGDSGNKLDSFLLSISKENNAARNVNFNSSENQIVYPITDTHQ
jgi:hypothetical protein